MGIDITIYQVDKKEVASLPADARIVRIKNPDDTLREVAEFRKYFHAVAYCIGNLPELSTSQFECVLFTPELWGRMRKALVTGKWGDDQLPYVDKFICDVDLLFVECCGEDYQLLFYWD